MKKHKIIPRGKQILVQQQEEESRITEHGLVTPKTVEQERKSIGSVIEIGKDIKDIKKGDIVIFGAFAGEKIQMKEGSKCIDYVLLHDDDVLAFLR